MEAIDLLPIKGSTHFMIGFVCGYLLFQILLLARHGNNKVALYAPLLPFVVGVWFSVPYLSEILGAGELEDQIGVIVNLFGAYGWLHHSSFAITYMDGLNKVTLVCGIVYLMIVWHYIKLIKGLRGKYAR